MSFPISRYLNIRSASDPSISGDGRWLAFLTNITGTSQVWQVELAERLGQPPWPDQLTFEVDRVLGVWFLPGIDDKRLIYCYDVGGDENMQLDLLDVERGVVMTLTAGYEKSMHIFGCWLGDGESFLFAANRRDPGLFDLYRQRIGEEAELVWKNEKAGFLFDISASPDGRYAAAVLMIGSFECDLYEIGLETGQVRQLLVAGEVAFHGKINYAKDGRSLFLVTDSNSDFFRMGRLDLASGALEILAAPEWDVDNLVVSPDGKQLVYAVNVGGDYSLHVYDLEEGTTRSGPRVGDVAGVVGSFFERLVFSPDSKRLAFAYSSATRTADIYVWDLASDEVRPVTQSSHGGLPQGSFVGAELIQYPTFDEVESGKRREIPAWFYKTAGKEKEGELVPVVVLMHGGPESQILPNFLFIVQFLVNNGYAVLAPNVRGSTGYGKAYSHLDDVKKRMDSVADMAYAAYWLKEQPEVDGDRLVLYGGSYGGFMVLAGMTSYPGLWAAGVNIVGISNFVTFLENTSDYRRGHREAEYGSLEHDRKFLERISPLNHIDKIKAPLMIIHGENDPRVPASETRQLAEGLEKQSVPVELLLFDDEGHGLAKLKNKLVAYPAVVEFLDKYV